MIIATPSYKRADNCRTAKYLSKAVIFCHEFEKEEYAKHNKNKIVTIPDELRGKGMAIIRNYILDNTEGDKVWMIDDDVKFFGYYEKSIQHKMTESEVYRMGADHFRMCREAGTALWGVGLNYDRRLYNEYAPFSLSSVVLGPCMGIIKDKYIRFDESLGLKEDYDYSLQVLLKYRKILRFNRYHYNCGHIMLRGGCRSYRTSDKEKEQAKRFERKWGSHIVKIKRKTYDGNETINPIVIVPIKGI